MPEKNQAEEQKKKKKRIVVPKLTISSLSEIPDEALQRTTERRFSRPWLEQAVLFMLHNPGTVNKEQLYNLFRFVYQAENINVLVKEFAQATKMSAPPAAEKNKVRPEILALIKKHVTSALFQGASVINAWDIHEKVRADGYNITVDTVRYNLIKMQGNEIPSKVAIVQKVLKPNRAPRFTDRDMLRKVREYFKSPSKRRRPR